jgi:hypothetical protein
MFLDYLALFMLLLSLTVVFYGFIYIHDLPHKIAKERGHPHAEAIHVACWLSLVTLHAMWPLVFTWAVSHRKGDYAADLDGDLRRRLQEIEERLRKIETPAK